MARDYAQQSWENSPATTTPLSAVRMAYIEGGVDDVVEDVQAHEDAAAPHSGHETPAGAQAKVDSHAAVTNPHSAATAPTASRLALRDGSGRCQFADPSAAADAATKGYVDAAIANISQVKELVFTLAGNLAVGDNAAPFDHDTRGGIGTLIEVVVRAKSAPTGTAAKLNLAYMNDDGSGRTDLFAAGNRPELAVNAKRATAATFAVASIPAAKRLQVDVDQVGSLIQGADVIVYLRYTDAPGGG